MKIGVIIQARMGSSRLPGKILMDVNGKSLLEYQLERVRNATLINDIIIATTTNEADDVIEAFCIESNVNFFRGSESDVLERYYLCAKKYHLDVVVRLTSDCPVIDPKVVDEVVKTFIENKTLCDYVSNTLDRTYPRGMDTEVMNFGALEKAYLESTEEFFREHVTTYIYNNPESFNLISVKAIEDNSDLRLTVDTIEDFTLIKNIFESLYRNSRNFSLDDIVSLLRKNPELIKINEHIEQKKT